MKNAPTGIRVLSTILKSMKRTFSHYRHNLLIHQRKLLECYVNAAKNLFDVFSEDEEAFLVTLATQNGLAIANAEISWLY